MTGWTLDKAKTAFPSGCPVYHRGTTVLAGVVTSHYVDGFGNVRVRVAGQKGGFLALALEAR